MLGMTRALVIFESCRRKRDFFLQGFMDETPNAKLSLI